MNIPAFLKVHSVTKKILIKVLKAGKVVPGKRTLFKKESNVVNAQVTGIGNSVTDVT